MQEPKMQEPKTMQQYQDMALDSEARARRAANAVTGSSLAARVENCLFGGGVKTVEALRDVRDEVAAACGEMAACQFWGLLSATFASGHEEEKREFISRVRETGPKPVHVGAPTWENVLADIDARSRV